jgi:hypothetical protein
MSLFQAKGIRYGTELEGETEDDIVREDRSPSNPVVNSTPDPILCSSDGPKMRRSKTRSWGRGIRRSAQQPEQREEAVIKERRTHLDPVLCPSFSPTMRLGSLVLEQNKRSSSFGNRLLGRRKVGPV